MIKNDKYKLTSQSNFKVVYQKEQSPNKLLIIYENIEYVN